MILDKDDAIYAANKFMNYYENFGRIDDYLREVKLSRMRDLPDAGFMPWEDDLFSDWDMHPNDMKIGVYLKNINNTVYNTLLEITTSHAVETSIPGKQLKVMVREENTGKWIGFIRFGSPTINSKPRNDMLGRPLNTLDPDEMARFNSSAIMGFNIVPTQPFGFNYLGGKLMAAICCSHHIRRELNKKYNANICMFETTSLYGSSKVLSMYDGMKPFLRFKGLTQSDFTPSLHDDEFRNFSEWFIKRNNGENLVADDASSRKLKMQTKMISVTKASLKINDPDTYIKFLKSIEDAKELTEQKKQYMSDYGFENVPEYIRGETDILKKKENYDRFELDSIIDWWKKKASSRYDKLKQEGTLRREQECWNLRQDLDIIRGKKDEKTGKII